MTIFLDSSSGIPYIVLWFNVCNKELLALRNNFRATNSSLLPSSTVVVKSAESSELMPAPSDSVNLDYEGARQRRHGLLACRHLSLHQ